ncbi:ABC1 kinase family protein [Luteolibacter sp. AS25]|uniref:ABC1 kinase family protein n=1 Tax=Luteolibacter sp. AS25 TaxID=3135776 RepID=UPI00398A53BD
MKVAPTHLKRYKDVALLFWKHGNSEIANEGDFATTSEFTEAEGKADAEDLAKDLEKLGPTFVKIGQLLSTRSDLISPLYMDALSRLQDDVEPVPYDQIEQIVQDQLGVRISKAFNEFEERPLGAASLGQVHRATLRNGRKVAVKVQRPNIRKEIVTDLESLQEIADFMEERTEFGKRYEVGRVLSEFRTSLMNELDYNKEANQLKELGKNLKSFERLVIPRVVDDYSTGLVLTMDYLPGTKVTSLSGAILADLDGESLADELFRAYLQQILVDGYFHADPHPGNLLLTPDHKIAILDLGMVGRINERLRDQLVHLLAGISHGDGLQTAEAAIRIGESRGESIDRNKFINRIDDLVGQSNSSDLEGLQIGGVVLLVMQACAEVGIRIPAEINLLGKTLMNLDRVGIALSPKFNPSAAIRKNLETLSTARLKDTFSMASIMGILTEMKDMMSTLPRKTNEILDLAANNKLKVKVDMIDEKTLMKGFQKIANRITMGLILAALIIGSSMLARVPTSFEIWGYPGLAIIFFFVAALGAIWLLIDILFKDE